MEVDRALYRLARRVEVCLPGNNLATGSVNVEVLPAELGVGPSVACAANAEEWTHRTIRARELAVREPSDGHAGAGLQSQDASRTFGRDRLSRRARRQRLGENGARNLRPSLAFGAPSDAPAAAKELTEVQYLLLRRPGQVRRDRRTKRIDHARGHLPTILTRAFGR